MQMTLWRSFETFEKIYASIITRDIAIVSKYGSHLSSWNSVCIILMILFGIFLFGSILVFYNHWSELTRRRRLLGSSGILLGIFLLIMGTYFFHTDNPDNQLYTVPSFMEKDAGIKRITSKDTQKAVESVRGGLKWISEFIRGKKPNDGLTEVERFAQKKVKRPKDVQNLKAEDMIVTDYKELREEADSLPENSPLRQAIESKLKQVPDTVVSEYEAMRRASESGGTTPEELRSIFEEYDEHAPGAGPTTTRDTTTASAAEEASHTPGTTGHTGTGTTGTTGTGTGTGTGHTGTGTTGTTGTGTGAAAGASHPWYASWVPGMRDYVLAPIWRGTKATAGATWGGLRGTAGALKRYTWKPISSLTEDLNTLRLARNDYEKRLSELYQQKEDILHASFSLDRKRRDLQSIDSQIESITTTFNEAARTFGEKHPHMAWAGWSSPSQANAVGSGKLRHAAESSVEGDKIRVPLTEEEYIRYSDKTGAKDLGGGKYALEFDKSTVPEYASDYTVEGHPLRVFSTGPADTPQSGLLYDRVRPYAERQTQRLNELERRKAIYTQLGNNEAAEQVQQSIDSIKNNAFADLSELEDLWTRIDNPTGDLLNKLTFNQESPFTSKHSFRADLTPKDAKALQKFYRTPEEQLENLGGLLMEGNTFTPMDGLVRDGKFVEPHYWFEPRFVTDEGKPVILGIPRGATEPHLAGTSYEGRRANATDDIHLGWDGWLYGSAGERLHGMDQMAVDATHFRKYTPDPEGGTMPDGTPFFLDEKGWPILGQGSKYYSWQLKNNRNDGRLLKFHRGRYYLAEHPFTTLTGLYLANTAADAAMPEVWGEAKKRAGDAIAAVADDAKSVVFGSGDEPTASASEGGGSPGPTPELPPPSTDSFFDVPSNKLHELITDWAPDLADKPYAHAVGGAGVGAAVGAGLGALSYFLPDSTLSEEEKKRKSLLKSMLSGTFAGMTAGGVLGGIDDFRRS